MSNSYKRKVGVVYRLHHVLWLIVLSTPRKSCSVTYRALRYVQHGKEKEDWSQWITNG